MKVSLLIEILQTTLKSRGDIEVFLRWEGTTSLVTDEQFSYIKQSLTLQSRNTVDCALVLIRLKDKILALKQPDGTYTLPGGKVHHGEAISDAARRECLEETGYTVKLCPYINAFVGTDANGNRVFTFDGDFVDHTEKSLDFREGEPVWVEPKEIVSGKYAEYNANVLLFFDISYTL